MFANGPVDLGSIPGHVIPKTFKMVHDTFTNRVGQNFFKGISSVSLFNGISTLFRLFNTKAILLEEQ